jgi:hypothetical protein
MGKFAKGRKWRSGEEKMSCEIGYKGVEIRTYHYELFYHRKTKEHGERVTTEEFTYEI